MKENIVRCCFRARFAEEIVVEDPSNAQRGNIDG